MGYLMYRSISSESPMYVGSSGICESPVYVGSSGICEISCEAFRVLVSLIAHDCSIIQSYVSHR
jgi:hypothetical protein